MTQVKVDKCDFCNGKLSGRIEKNKETGKEVYGLYCNKCKQWVYKQQKLLDNTYMEADHQIYHILLVGGGNERQIEQIASIAKLSIYEAGQYLRSERKIILYEGNAKDIYENAKNLTKHGLLYEIEPEFPYEILYKISEKEREQITEIILNSILR